MMPTSEYEYNLINQERTGQLAPDVTRTEWEQIERLEETDPSTDDGRWGGDRCVHGTYIGTPGGADYMCGYCEEGLDFWVEDPSYRLTVQLSGMAFPSVLGQPVYPTSTERWNMRRIAAMRRAIRAFSVVEAGLPAPLRRLPVFQMELVNAGRWESPYVTIKTNVALHFKPEGVEDVEEAIALQLGVPAPNVMIDLDTGDLHRKGLGWTLTDVEANIDRRDLDGEQLLRVAAMEVES